MLKTFPVGGLAVATALSAADGLVASYDIDQYTKSNAGKVGAPPAGTAPPLLQGKAVWLQGGAFALGLVGEFAGWHPDYTEALMLTSAGLAAREVALHMAQARQTTPAAVQAYAAPVAAPQAARALQARPAMAGGPGDGMLEQPTIAG